MRETLSFALGSLGSARWVLEVGAGDGALARRLMDAGYVVVALDGSVEAVEAARAKGIDAREVVWPAFLDEGFDAVLFTRSLHHIHPLGEALDRAHAVLVPGGRIVVEDFAFSDADVPTIEWFRDALASLRDTGRLQAQADAFAWEILEAQDPERAWRLHGSDLTPASAIRRGLEERFDGVGEVPAPYLYRYLVDLVEAPVLAEFLELERRSADAGSISFVGRRYVGGRKEDRT